MEYVEVELKLDFLNESVDMLESVRSAFLHFKSERAVSGRADELDIAFKVTEVSLLYIIKAKNIQTKTALGDIL
jgi:hypothetical protein